MYIEGLYEEGIIISKTLKFVFCRRKYSLKLTKHTIWRTSFLFTYKYFSKTYIIVINLFWVKQQQKTQKLTTVISNIDLASWTILKLQFYWS